MNQPDNLFAKIFGVVIRGQTYLNLIYLLLAFPLSLIYFIILTVGFFAGVPLILVCVGLLLLPLTAAAWVGFVATERQLAIWLLRVEIPPLVARDLKGKPAGEQIMAYFTSPAIWKGLLYLLLKFPLGIFTFVVTVFFGTLTFVFLTAPLTFFWVPVEIGITGDLVWAIDTWWEALLVFPIGVVLVFISLHIFNLMALGWSWLSKVMLGDSRQPSTFLPSAPAPAFAPVPPDEQTGEEPDVAASNQMGVQDTPDEPEAETDAPEGDKPES